MYPIGVISVFAGIEPWDLGLDLVIVEDDRDCRQGRFSAWLNVHHRPQEARGGVEAHSGLRPWLCALLGDGRQFRFIDERAPKFATAAQGDEADAANGDLAGRLSEEDLNTTFASVSVRET